MKIFLSKRLYFGRENFLGRMKEVSISGQNRIRSEMKRLRQGIVLESKNYSLAFHYRQAKNKHAAKEKIMVFAQNLMPTPRLVTTI